MERHPRTGSGPARTCWRNGTRRARKNRVTCRGIPMGRTATCTKQTHPTVIMATTIDKESGPSRNRKAASNPDPITGEPGSHPIGTGLGAAGGAAVGMAIGAVGGPVGAAIGATAGAIVGGLAGHSAAEAIDPTVEDAYWRDSFADREYVEPGSSFDVYSDAYRTGYEGRNRYTGQTFDEAESALAADYRNSRGSAALGWDRAKHAARDAWNRVERSLDRRGDPPAATRHEPAASTAPVDVSPAPPITEPIPEKADKTVATGEAYDSDYPPQGEDGLARVWHKVAGDPDTRSAQKMPPP